MKNLLLLMIFCINGMLALGQSFDPDAAIQEISQAAAAINTMQCDFSQTKSLKLLGDKLVSKGVMYCQQPDKLRWEYTSPYSYIFILNGNKVLLKKGDRNDVVDVNQNKMFKEIARIMMNSVLGKCLTDKNDFKLSVTNQPQYYVITLLPQKKEMKQMFSQIVLHFDKQQKMVTKVELNEKNGDKTLIELNDIKKNIKINASTFNIN